MNAFDEAFAPSGNAFDEVFEPKRDWMGNYPASGSTPEVGRVQHVIEGQEIPRSREELEIRNLQSRRIPGGYAIPAGVSGSPLLPSVITDPIANRITPQTAQDALDTFAYYTSGGMAGAPLKAQSTPPSTVAQIGAGVQNLATSTTSPLALASLGAGLLPGAAARAVSGGFLADTAYHLPDVAQAAGQASVDGSLAEKIESYGGLGLAAVSAPGMALHVRGSPSERAVARAGEIVRDAPLPDVDAAAVARLDPRGGEFQPLPPTEVNRIKMTRENIARALETGIGEIEVPRGFSPVDALIAERRFGPAEQQTVVPRKILPVERPAPRQDIEGGQVSFRQGPTGITDIVPEQTRQAFRREDQAVSAPETVPTDIITRLESLKDSSLTGLQSAIIPGLDAASFKAIRNTAIDIAIVAIKAGRTAGDAITAAVEHIRSKAGKDFNEESARKMIEEAVSSPSEQLKEANSRSGSRAAFSTAPDAVRASYPETFDVPTYGQLPVEIMRPDGSTYGGVFNGWLETIKPGTSREDYLAGKGTVQVPSIGTRQEGSWSHGSLKAGEKLLSEVPTPEEFRAARAKTQFPDFEAMAKEKIQAGQPSLKQQAYDWADQTLKESGGRIGSGPDLDPRVFAAHAIRLARLLEQGAVKFKDWAADMVKEHGPTIRPQLESIWREALVSAGGRPASVSGSGGASASGTPPARRAGGVSLDDVYSIFEPAPKPGSSVGQMASKTIEAVRTGVSSKFRPLDKLAEDIAKTYGANTPKGVSGIFEQLKGSSGKGEADVYRFDRAVSDLVKGSEKDFNAYMFLRRSIDRLEADARTGETRRKVAGFTLPGLQARLQLLQSRLAPEQLSAFPKAADAYQQHLDQALQLQVESGRMSPETYAEIKRGNQFYAPFKVMKYLEETTRPAGTGARVDTAARYTKAMEGIESPDFKLGDMLAAGRQNLLLSRILAEKNTAMRRVADMAPFDTEGTFIRKLKPHEEVPIGEQAVNVFEGGIQERYVVPDNVAEAIQVYQGTTTGELVTKILGAGGGLFRAGATTLNLPFQFSNLMADLPRTSLISKYGITNPMEAVRFPIELGEALLTSIVGNVAGYKNKLFLDFLDSGAAGTTIAEYLRPEALQFKTPDAVSKSRKLAGTVLNTVNDFSQAFEQTSKILGVKRAMRFEGASSGAELARRIPAAITEIRRFSGSPDFGRIGKWTEQARANLLLMFLNARIQGNVADVGRLLGRDGSRRAAVTATRLGLAVGVPSALLYLLNTSDKYAADYEKRSEQEKQNYWLIPKDSFITTEDGERMRDYWRIPKREAAKMTANATEATLRFAERRDPQQFGEWAGTMIEELSPVNIQGKNLPERMESVASGLNPVLKAPLEVATGRDLYRHRSIVPEAQKKASPENQYTDRTSEVFKKLAQAVPDVAPEVFRSPLMLENMTKNLTAGLITQFLPQKPVAGRSGIENQPLLQRFQALPFSDQSKTQEQIRGFEREAADESLARHRLALKAIEGRSSVKEAARELVRLGGNEKAVEHMVDLWVANKNGITQQERQILGLPVRQRAMFIADQIKGLSGEARSARLRDYARKRILSEGVAEELLPMLAE